MEIRVGSVLLDRFEIKRRLGKGSYGVVFEAFDNSDQTPVAVKVSYFCRQNKERNITEAKLMECIKESESPYRGHVVDLKVWYEFENCVVLVMELLSHDLLKGIKNYTFDLSLLATYARQMVEGLLLLSQLKIVHGDLKPENILVEDGGKAVKFSDFGLSYSSSLGWVPQEIQTIHYRAPDAMLGYKCGPSVDTWSLGCVLLECVTKNLLFPIQRDEFELMQMITNVVGYPSQKMIREAPLRNNFFWYHPESQRWILKGAAPYDRPMGLKKYFQFNYPDKGYKPEIIMLLDFVDKMLKPDPDARTKPETLLQHPFLSQKFPLRKKKVK